MVTSSGRVGFESGKRRFDLPRDFDGVGIRLLLNRGDNIRMHVEAAVAALQCGPKLHSGDVLHKDRRSVPDGDDRVRQVFEAVHAASRADQVFLGGPFQKSARSS